jgi:hypothetical protein
MVYCDSGSGYGSDFSNNFGSDSGSGSRQYSAQSFNIEKICTKSSCFNFKGSIFSKKVGHSILIFRHLRSIFIFDQYPNPVPGPEP